MSAVAQAVVCLIAALAAFAASFALVRVGRRDARALDDTWSGPQKIHETPVPRIGGVAIAAGMMAGALLVTLITGHGVHFWLLLFCVLPGFAWGLREDVSKDGAVFARLAITGCSAMLAYVLLDARITELDVFGLDRLLLVPAFSFAFTVFAVTGVGHSMNVVDGLNGLSGVTSLLAAVGLAIVGWTVGDHLVSCAATVLAGSLLGFLVLNFPRGRLFLGDGGAYLIGLLLAELSVLLVQRNSSVSPWFPLMLLAYPIWETLFTMYRRRVRRRSTGHADALHLHSLVYRRVVPASVCGGGKQHCWARNALASLVLWIAPVLCWIPAVAFWDQSDLLQLCAFTFALIYMLVYRGIVHFGVPRALAVRLGKGADLLGESLAPEGK